MDNLAVYDRELAVERAGGSPELATDLFGMLMKELPVHRANLAAALADQNLTALQHCAHKLNGSATYTGVSALRHVVASLELNLKRGQIDDLAGQVAGVLREIDRVISFAENRH